MSDYTKQIQEIIDQAQEDGRAEGRAQAEADFKERMFGAFPSVGKKSKRTASFKAARKAIKKSSKRTPGDLETMYKTLRTYITKHPGMRIEKIAEALELPTNDLKLPAKKLIAEGAVSTKGTRRATAYFPK